MFQQKVRHKLRQLAELERQPGRGYFGYLHRTCREVICLEVLVWSRRDLTSVAGELTRRELYVGLKMGTPNVQL